MGKAKLWKAVILVRTTPATLKTFVGCFKAKFLVAQGTVLEVLDAHVAFDVVGVLAFIIGADMIACTKIFPTEFYLVAYFAVVGCDLAQTNASAVGASLEFVCCHVVVNIMREGTWVSITTMIRYKSATKWLG